MISDLHTHILPAIDDGARSLDESEAMLAMYADLGFETIVATPHVTIDDILHQATLADELLGRLQPTAAALGLRLRRAGEIRLDPDIAAQPDLLRDYTLDGSRYLLVDFASGVWPFYAEDALFQVQMQGFTPILAHPERFGWSADQRSLAKELVSRGVLLQVTLGSLTGTFGKSAAVTARALLDGGLVHILATDAHGPGTRLLAAEKGIEWMTEFHGEQAISQLLVEGPQSILNSEDVEPFVPTRRSGWVSALRDRWRSWTW